MKNDRSQLHRQFPQIQTRRVFSALREPIDSDEISQIPVWKGLE